MPVAMYVECESTRYYILSPHAIVAMDGGVVYLLNYSVSTVYRVV
jgi:hypothetical protein